MSIPAQSPQKKSVFAPDLLSVGAKEAFVKLDPRKVARNSVMFVVEIGTIVTLLFALGNLFTGQPFGYELAVTLLLFFTLLLRQLR